MDVHPLFAALIHDKLWLPRDPLKIRKLKDYQGKDEEAADDGD